MTSVVHEIVSRDTWHFVTPPTDTAIPMSLLYGLLWRFLLALVHANRGLVSWFRARLPFWKDGLWQGIRAALLLPLTLIGVSDQPKKPHQNPSDTRTGAVGRSWRWQSDLACLEKLPVHIGLLVTEEELSYTDIATLVVWCMAVGISYISVYDTCGNTLLLLCYYLRRYYALSWWEHPHIDLFASCISPS